MAAGLAALAVIEDEGLVENARQDAASRCAPGSPRWPTAST